MKNSILFLLFSISTLYASAQIVYEGVYDNHFEPIQNNYSFNLYSTTIFPDSLVQTMYVDGFGNPYLGYVSTHGVGEVFDPKSAIYNHPIETYNPYSVDTVGIAYLYNYVYEPGAAPDTLIFQFYAGAGPGGGIDTGTFQANPSTGFPKELYAYTIYSLIKNLGLNSVGQYKYVLGPKDSTSGYTFQSIKGIFVPTNGASGIQAKANDLFAYTVSYRPGFKYQAGDTIDENYQPANLHSHFTVFIENTQSKTTNPGYEQSLSVVNQNRYDLSPAWDGRYIPGTAWDGYNQMLWSDFSVHVREIASDAGLDGFSSPVHPDVAVPSPYCGNETIPVTVYLTNFLGGSNLTSATISWMANNVRQKDFQWTGKISPDSSTTVAIGSSAFSGGYDNVKAWVSNPNGVTDSLPGNDTTILNFYVNPLPSAHFTDATITSQLIQFTPDDQTLYSYYWDFGDGTGSGALTPSHLYSKSGTYTVSLLTESQHTCRSSFDTIVTISNSAIDIPSEDAFDLNLYPNPFNSSIAIRYSIKNSAHITTALYDALGKEICCLVDQTQSPGEYQLVIDAQIYHLAPGVYTLKFSTGSGYISKRIVKF